LLKEYEQEDIDSIMSGWLPGYSEKFASFQQEILDLFGMQEEIVPVWYNYHTGNRSKILIKVEQDGKLNLLDQVVKKVKLKDEYKDYFESFSIKINRTHIEKQASRLLSMLENKTDSTINSEIENLSRRLGSEKRLAEIEQEILTRYPELQQVTSTPKISKKQKELALKNKVQSILDKLPDMKQKAVNTIDLDGSYSNEQIPNQTKKLIFKGTALPNKKALETMGASGEEEVLLLCINEFILMTDVKERKKAIDEIYELLRKKVGDDSLAIYKDKCLNVIEDDIALQKALIPFFYVTMHHKFSYFDLIVYYENKPTLVEVKTTTNRKNFFISAAEINLACGEDNYLIVRVTNDSINFLGNPIKEIEDSILFVKGDKFSLKPTGYEFVLND